MRLITKASIATLFILFIIAPAYPTQEPSSFEGEVNADNINVRSDSTTASEVVCKLNKGDLVEVVSQLYDWYKIRLPKCAPSFIKKELVADAKVIKERVNIRLFPSESAPILGKVNNAEEVNILEETGQWYKIKPVYNSFGWIHKKFVKIPQGGLKAVEKEKEEIKEQNSEEEGITLEGIVRPYGKVFKRIATHKLITGDNKIYLLKGNKEALNVVNNRRVKVTGKLLIAADTQKYPVIEIINIGMAD